MPHRSSLAAHYDAVWNAAVADVRQGRVTLDPWAQRKRDDPRRGVTLLARPAPAVAASLAAFAAGLRAIEPDQYFQPAEDLHFTILSLFTATAEYRRYLAHLGAYRAAVAEAAEGAAPFSIETAGVTLSRGAVLVQGFPQGAALAQLRARLRSALAARGLSGSLDERYRLETAHVTLLRFAAPLRAPGRFVDALEGARSRPFGTSRVTRLELVLGDWYQSSERARPVMAFDLCDGSP